MAEEISMLAREHTDIGDSLSVSRRKKTAFSEHRTELEVIRKHNSYNTLCIYISPSPSLQHPEMRTPLYTVELLYSNTLK